MPHFAKNAIIINQEIMRNFENWETQDLEIAFDLEKNKEMALLKDWLSATTTFDIETKTELELLKDKILEFADYWNEDELKMQCISKMVDFSGYYKDKNYNVFSQRPLSATINGIEISLQKVSKSL